MCEWPVAEYFDEVMPAIHPVLRLLGLSGQADMPTDELELKMKKPVGT